MLNILGLSHDTIPYVVDDTPGSSGLFVPGVGSKVINTSDSAFLNTDFALITAPTHIEEILNKEQKRNLSMCFIRTSPTLSYVSNFS